MCISQITLYDNCYLYFLIWQYWKLFLALQHSENLCGFEAELNVAVTALKVSMFPVHVAAIPGERENSVDTLPVPHWVKDSLKIYFVNLKIN